MAFMTTKKGLISLIIINYNTRNLLQGCIDSILKQTYSPIEVLFIDNASHDGSAELVEGLYAASIESGNLRVIKNPDNKGYAGAANQGIELTQGEYIVITNPDIRYEPDYFEKALVVMNRDAKIAAVTGKVKKYDFATADESARKTNLIDTVGLFAYKTRRIIDDGQGLPDDGRFDEEKEVFGISGACPLYRREALEDAKITANEYLDDDFFMYKEDVDLAWRLQLLGWKAVYTPTALAYHGRGTGVAKRFTASELLGERAKLGRFQKHYSLGNQWLMQTKNELWGNFWHDFFWIVGRIFGACGYALLREPFLWKAVVRFFRLWPRALKKRKELMKKVRERKSANAKSMQKWFGEQSQYYRK